MKVRIANRGGKEYGTLEVSENTSFEDFRKKFQTIKKVDVHRMRFTLGDGKDKKVLKHGQTLGSIGVKDGDTLIFKDLGPQISWRGVFFVEYFGPLVAPVLIVVLSRFIYGTEVEYNQAQWYGLLAFFLHFLKREYETIFVHRFSSDTMPIVNLFRNSGYYWIFAFLVVYFLGHPLYTAPASEFQVYLGMGIYAVSEISNFITHIMLRNLRPAGSRVRKIPRGFAFELVSCPNYFFEIMAWLGFNIATQTLGGYLFMLVGAGQMLIWAKGKHRRYRKEFPDYPKGRKAIFPFIY